MNKVTVPKKRNARIHGNFKNLVLIYLFALPAILYFAIFTYFPSILGFIISFQKYKLVGKNEWVGFANYIKVFTTYGFWNVAKNTAIIGISSLVVKIIFPVIVALLLNEILHPLWKKFVQTSIYISHLFGWVVIAGIWIFVLAPDKGILNIFLGQFGIEPINFMSKAEYGKPLVVFLDLWHDIGYLCILYLASISTINPELYESAVIDGAGRLRQAFSITLPSILPTIQVLAILSVTGMFKLFDPIWVLRNFGNNMAIDTVMIYIKRYGIDHLQMGYTSAVSVVVFVAILTVTLLTKRVLRYRI